MPGEVGSDPGKRDRGWRSRRPCDAEETSRTLATLYAPIAAELAEAERIFAAELGSRFPFVQHLVDHCADFRGKRLRPALVLLTGQACGAVRRPTRSWRRSSR